MLDQSDLEAAWNAFIAVAQKTWPEGSDAFHRMVPALKMLHDEIHGAEPRLVYEDNGTHYHITFPHRA